MLRKIWNVLKGIGEFFSTLINIVKAIIDAIIAFFVFLGKAIAYLFNILGFVPGVMFSFFVVFVMVLVIRKIVNR